MDPMKAALAALDSLKPGECLNYTATAKKFGIGRDALSRRHRGIQGSREQQYGNQQNLSPVQESHLIEYVDRLCERGLPPTKRMIRNFAQEIAQKYVGNNWIDRFLKRHNIDIYTRWASGMEKERKEADSAFKYALYFKLLERKLEEYKIQPRLIYNMDEKGFLIGKLSKMKRIFTQRTWEERGIKQMIEDGNREWVTVIGCICADGTWHPPTCIYKGTSGYLRENWIEGFDPVKYDCDFTTSPTGWTNDDLGYKWLLKFNERTKKKARQAYRLLILDGHGSHVTMKFINFCDMNRIILGIYPPHSTHTLQPLDVALFRPLSQAYSERLTAWIAKTEGFSNIQKRHFFTLFWPAWNDSFTEENILSGFESTGINPFNPQRVITKFEKKSQKDRPSSSESVSSLKAEDWRRISELLHSVVDNIFDKQAQRLNDTVHKLAMDNLTLQMENSNLKSRLKEERKKKANKRQLKTPVDTSADGGAIFYTPKVVQKVQDYFSEKDQRAEQLRIEKAEKKARREAEKLEKQQKKNQRVKKRVKNNAEKQHLEEEENISEQAGQRLQNDLGQARAPKRRQSLIASGEGTDVDEESVVEMAKVVPRVNTRGRKIIVPARFLD
jgi:hypothetical protein